MTAAAAVHFAASIDALMNHSTLDAASRHVIAQISCTAPLPSRYGTSDSY